MSSTSSPPSRQTACDPCVRAKRRCDRSSPQCSRCVSRSLNCIYKNEPLTAPTVSFECMQLSDFMLDVDFDPFSGLNLVNPPATDNSETPLTPALSSRLLRWSSIQSQDTKTWMINHLKTYPCMFVVHGNTPFIHARLYRVHLPKVIQDTFSVCATYQTMNESNKSMVLRIIETKVKELIENDVHSFSWSLAESLGFVQALVLIQTMLLFSGDIRLCALGEGNEQLLIKWTKQLDWQLHSELNNSQQQQTQSWVEAESTRRTIIMAYIVKAVYRFCKFGVCTEDGYAHAIRMQQLQLTAAAPLWDSPLENSSDCLQPLISYAELEHELPWSEYLPPFEKLLLVVCKGEECGELILSS